MEYVAIDSNREMENSIVIKSIKEKDLIKFPEQSFCNLEKKVKKGLPLMGIYDIEKNVLGFGCVQPKGEQADYFNIKNCDFYISGLFIYPEY